MYQNKNHSWLHIKRKTEFTISQKNEDIESQNVSMTFSVYMFYKLSHNHRHQTKPYGVHGLIWHYHLQFEPKLGQGKCEIWHVPCVCNSCTDHLDFLWIPIFSDDKQPRYQLSQHHVYSNILGELNECNIIMLRDKDKYLK